VQKVIAAAKDPVRASLGFLAGHPAELVVLAVHQHQGRMRWFEKSVGEPIARGAGQMTLFIPHGMAGFVSQADGLRCHRERPSSANRGTCSAAESRPTLGETIFSSR